MTNYGDKAQTIGAHDIYMVFDCQKSGRHSQFLSAFNYNKNPIPCSKPTKMLFNTFRQPESFDKRFSQRGFAAHNSMDNQHTVIISKDVFGTGMKMKERKYADGNNLSKR